MNQKISKARQKLNRFVLSTNVQFQSQSNANGGQGDIVRVGSPSFGMKQNPNSNSERVLSPYPHRDKETSIELTI